MHFDYLASHRLFRHLNRDAWAKTGKRPRTNASGATCFGALLCLGSVL